jgi:hypothetical protein
VNSFQAVIATDGSLTFVLFLYQDIQWSIASSIGFNSGDPNRFYNLPESQLRNLVLDLEMFSNIGRPGIFAFRVDQEDIILPSTSGKP